MKPLKRSPVQSRGPSPVRSSFRLDYPPLSLIRTDEVDSMLIFSPTDHLASSTTAFVFYWLALLAIASLELVIPGRAKQAPLGPRLRVNFILGIAGALLQAIPLMSEVAMATLAAQRGLGLINQFRLTEVTQIGLSFLAFDLFGYGMHRLAHKWPVLWRLHRVHHSDNDIDLSTLFRSHPLDVLITTALALMFIVLAGLHPLGILLHGMAKLVTMALGHANIVARPLLSRAVAMVLVTPAFHAVHHSALQPETDSNYGEVLTIWDRAFRSISRLTGPIERFGLGERYDAGSANLAEQLRLPLTPL